MIESFRIVKSKYARTAFDGEGAKIYGGRWNHEGHAVVYTASSLALAALELFVQLDGPPVVSLVSISITIPNHVSIKTLNTLPKGWDTYPISVGTQDLGTEWLKEKKYAVLKVPSIIIHTEFNYLLNPNHDDFKDIKIGEAEDFTFDHRMWKKQ